MEHIIQFGITVDDDRICKTIEERAEKDVLKHLCQRVDNMLFNSRYYGERGDPSAGPKQWVCDHLDAWLVEHNDALIECAAKYLADKLSRTKAARALLKGGDL